MNVATPTTVDLERGQSPVRRQMAAARRRIRRLKQIDRAAVGVITLGGIAVIISVIGILVFIGAEALPLFRAPHASLHSTFRPSGMVAPGSPAHALGIDESRWRRLTDEAHEVETMILPQPGGFVPDVLQRLRSALASPATTRHRRLYVSRNDAPTRRVANEGEVLAALEPLGFRSITLSGLSFAEQREAFVLKHVEGRSYEEIAAVMDLSVASLKMRVHRAREALKGLLREFA